MNLVVLFTYGYKMSDWAKKGHLQREAILYNTLADNGVYTTFITYGDKEDFKWENQFNDKIKIIPVYDKLYYFRSKVLRFIQSFFIPFYLKEILGSPETKSDHIRRIIRRYNYGSSEVVFIGDAINDKEAAELNGICFIGRRHRGNKNAFGDCLCNHDLTDLEEAIEKVDNNSLINKYKNSQNRLII